MSDETDETRTKEDFSNAERAELEAAGVISDPYKSGQYTTEYVKAVAKTPEERLAILKMVIRIGTCFGESRYAPPPNMIFIKALEAMAAGTRKAHMEAEAKEKPTRRWGGGLRKAS